MKCLPPVYQVPLYQDLGWSGQQILTKNFPECQLKFQCFFVPASFELIS